MKEKKEINRKQRPLFTMKESNAREIDLKKPRLQSLDSLNTLKSRKASIYQKQTISLPLISPASLDK